MNTLEALDAIEKALKFGDSRSIKAESAIYAKAFMGLKALQEEKRVGMRRVIRALRMAKENGRKK